MKKNNFLYATIGVVVGFIIGFLFANSANHSPVNNQTRAASTSNSMPQSANQTAPASNNQTEIADKDIREAISRADSRADDVSLQRNFGLALYKYANQQRDAQYLPDVARFLKRAYEADAKDYEVTVSLANALFDIGQTSDSSSFKQARIYYLKALETKPDDVNVRTDLGLTYFFDKPSDPQRAIIEYRKSLAIDPRHEQTLQNLATALIATKNYAEAEKIISALQSVNPSNEALPDLRGQLTQNQKAAQE